MKYLLMAGLWLAAATAAYADYRSEYKLYTEAFNAGDIGGAVEHGEAAWRAAEAELGDHPTTAVLAYNYARIVGNYAPDKALEAYERALELTRAGVASLDGTELEVRVARARLEIDIENKDLADALEQKLAAAEKSSEAPATDAPVTDALALGWKSLAVHRSSIRRITDATEAADKAIQHATPLKAEDPRLLAEALVLGASLRLAATHRDGEDMAEAVTLLDRAFPLFPPQYSIDTFDPLLARAMQLRSTAWTIATSAEIRPMVGRGKDTRLPARDSLASGYNRAVAKSDIDSQFSWAEPNPASCPRNAAWEERKPPSYPRSAIQRTFIGAVIVGYDMSETGVERSVLLADFDKAGFGEAALKSMEKWVLAEPVPPECRKNHLTTFTFKILPH